MSLVTRELELQPGKRLRGLRHCKPDSAAELGDVLKVVEQVCRALDGGETFLPDHTVSWCRIHLRTTAGYALRLAGLAAKHLAVVMAEDAQAVRARLVRSAEAIRVKAMEADQYSAAVAATRAQGDWLLPKEQPQGDQHVHLHFAAELDAVEQRMRAARAIAAGFPKLLPQVPPEQAYIDAQAISATESHKPLPPQGP